MSAKMIASADEMLCLLTVNGRMVGGTVGVVESRCGMVQAFVNLPIHNARQLYNALGDWLVSGDDDMSERKTELDPALECTWRKWLKTSANTVCGNRNHSLLYSHDHQALQAVCHRDRLSLTIWQIDEQNGVSIDLRTELATQLRTLIDDNY